MASRLKKAYNKYLGRNIKDSTFRSFVNLPTNEVSSPIDNSFKHINGTSPNIVERSKTILKEHVNIESLEHETDCIFISNSTFFSTLEEEKITLQCSNKDHKREADVPDGVVNDYIRPSLRPVFSFRNTNFIEPVRGSSFENDDYNLELESPDICFDQYRLTLQKTVADKYKLGDLVDEMDDRFFDMTEDEQIYQINNRSQDTKRCSSLSVKDDKNEPNDTISVEVDEKKLLGGRNDIATISTTAPMPARTPPPPPKPIRKNSQKRTEQTITSNVEVNEKNSVGSKGELAILSVTPPLQQKSIGPPPPRPSQKNSPKPHEPLTTTNEESNEDNGLN